jgi:hypothetical protein
MQRRPAHTIGGAADNRARVCANVFPQPRRADVRGAGRNRPQLQRRYSQPRRADTRCSCACAFLHRKNRILPANDRCNSARSGGRQPPRGFATATAPAFLGTATLVTPSLTGTLFEQRCCKCISIGITQPRRADARRSCERAFLHRKRRYFHGERTPFTAPGAGGVSPPWCRCTRTQRRPAHTIGGAADNRARVCVNVFPQPRRADVCGVGRKRPQLQRRYSQPRRADARRS